MVELFRRMWVGWNVAVRGFFGVQSAVLMGVAYFVGLGPVAVGMRLLGRDLLDRGPGAPGASSYWLPRDGRPMDMKAAARQF